MIQFNPIDQEDIFYPGLTDDKEQAKIKRSVVWPLALALHHRANRKLLVTAVASDRSSCTIYLATIAGFCPTNVAYQNGEYKINTYAWGNVHSVKINKMFQAIQGTDQFAMGTKLATVTAQETYMTYKHHISEALRDIVNTQGNLSLPSINLSPATQLELVEFMAEERQSTITQTTADNIKEEYNRYKIALKRREEAVNSIKEFIAKPKWLVSAKDGNYKFWHVAKINLSSLLQPAFMFYILNKNISANDIPSDFLLEEPRLYLYKTAGEFTDEVMGALTFLKVYNESNKMKLVYLDDDKYTPATELYYPDITVACVSVRGQMMVMVNAQ